MKLVLVAHDEEHDYQLSFLYSSFFPIYLEGPRLGLVWVVLFLIGLSAFVLSSTMFSECSES